MVSKVAPKASHTCLVRMCDPCEQSRLMTDLGFTMGVIEPNYTLDMFRKPNPNPSLLKVKYKPKIYTTFEQDILNPILAYTTRLWLLQTCIRVCLYLK